MIIALFMFFIAMTIVLWSTQNESNEFFISFIDWCSDLSWLYVLKIQWQSPPMTNKATPLIIDGIAGEI